MMQNGAEVLNRTIAAKSIQKDRALDQIYFSASSELLLARLVFPLYRAAFAQQFDAHREAKQLDDLALHLADADRFRFKISPEGVAEALVLGKTQKSSLGTVYYLSGILVAPELQGQGLGTQILADELKSTGATILALHTQSRRMLRVAEKLSIQNDDLIPELSASIGSKLPIGVLDKGRYGPERLYGSSVPARELINGEAKIHEGDARIFIGMVREEFL